LRSATSPPDTVIATNILAKRLDDFVDAGIMERHGAPPVVLTGLLSALLPRHEPLLPARRLPPELMP
jgi:hypothetical protein